MAESPDESELELIFERLREEWLMDMAYLRSEAAITERINGALRFWPMKNLGEQSKRRIREIGAERRTEMRSLVRRRQRRRELRGLARGGWTDGQVKELESLYTKGHIPVERIAARVGRTRKAVYMKAWRSGLRRP